MNLAKRAFQRMVAGHRKQKLREYYEDMSKARAEQGVEVRGGERIPVFIKPIVSPVEFPFPVRQGAGYPQPPAQQVQYVQAPQQQQQAQASQEQRPREEEHRPVDGYDIPQIGGKTEMADVRRGQARLKPIVYPLIPAKPKKGEPILAYAKIAWDQKQGRYFYEVVEPRMPAKIERVLGKIKELLEERLDIDFSRLKISEATDYLRSEIDKLVDYYKFNIGPDEKKILQYFIERDFMGLGKIEPLMHDSQIEDISCDGIGIPIFIFHRNPELGSVITNISFNEGDELDSFITKLAQLSGKSISVAEPLLDGALPDGSRLQATLATDIARKGSNFTIRKFSEEPLTPVHLLNYGTLDVRSLAYVWMAVDYGRSMLVSGGTASGKTSFLNAISLFIRPDKKIISIEDTAELRLPHPHWVPTVARTSVSGAAEGEREIDMFTLLKESLRQRPDYIIVGEVRGQEAFVLFQQMATGHPSYATIHAENMDKLVNRLTTAPISLPKTLVGSLDLIVFMLRVRYHDKFVRRSNEIIEMIDFEPERSRPNTNTVFKWNARTDGIDSVSKSTLLRKLTDVTGMTEEEIKDELKRRMAVLGWMQARNITEYKEVYKVVNMYYNFPNRLLGMISGEA